MVEETAKIKRSIRLDPWVLNEAYQGMTAHIFTCGPSLKEANLRQLRKQLQNSLVLCVKQTYHSFGEVADWHFINGTHYEDYQHHPGTITVYADTHHSIAKNRQKPFDVWVTIHERGVLSRSQAVVGQFDRWKEDYRFTTWGPGILYDAVFPICVTARVAKVVIYGWSLRYEGQSHFYDHTQKSIPSDEEVALLIDSTDLLYDWMSQQGIELEIATSSAASSKIKRTCKLFL